MKKLLKFALIALVLVVVALLIAVKVVTGHLTPQEFVKRIESNLNCRAEIGDVNVKLLSSPAGITLSGVVLGPRDQFAIDAAPLADRPPMDYQSIYCEAIVLEVELEDLIKRRLNIRKFSINGPRVQVTLNEDGTNSLDPLFEAPVDDAVPSEPAPTVAAEPPSPPATVDAAPPEGEDPLPPNPDMPPAPESPEGRPFHASDLPLAAAADVIEIENGSIYATIAKNGGSILIDELSFGIVDIKLDARDLANQNQANIGLGFLLGIDSPPQEGRRYAEFRVTGGGQLKPFDEVTGILDPQLIAELTIAEGSYIDAMPTLKKVEGLLERLEKLGVNLGEIDLRGDFKEPFVARLKYEGSTLTVINDAIVNLGDYMITLTQNSWVNANVNQHDFTGTVSATEETTKEAIAKVDKFLEEKASGLGGSGLRDTIMKPILKDGRITIGFRSSGSLEDPQVDLLTSVGSIQDVLNLTNPESIDQLKEQGKQLLDGLKGLFK